MANPQSQPPVVRSAQPPAGRGQPQLKVQTVQTYTGPTPPPEHIAAYEQMLPGAAERFLRIAETEIDHRRSIENDQMKVAKDTFIASSSLAFRGQLFAFIIAIFGIAGCVFLGINGATVPSSVIGGGSLVTIIAAFLKGGNNPNLPKPPQSN